MNKVRRIKKLSEKDKVFARKFNSLMASGSSTGKINLYRWQCCVCGKIYDWRYFAQNCKHKNTPFEKPKKKPKEKSFKELLAERGLKQ